jgi:hypothetical protein
VQKDKIMSTSASVVRAPADTQSPDSPETLITAKELANHTTGDADIVCRILILIDFDPRRPSGISATEPEDESRQNRMLDRFVVMSDVARSWGGLMGGTVVSLFVVSVGGILVYYDHDTAGAAITTTTVAALAKTFIHGTASRRQERRDTSPKR